MIYIRSMQIQVTFQCILASWFSFSFFTFLRFYIIDDSHCFSLIFDFFKCSCSCKCGHRHQMLYPSGVINWTNYIVQPNFDHFSYYYYYFLVWPPFFIFLLKNLNPKIRLRGFTLVLNTFGHSFITKNLKTTASKHSALHVHQWPDDNSSWIVVERLSFYSTMIHIPRFKHVTFMHSHISSSSIKLISGAWCI